MLGAACWLALAGVASPNADAAEKPPLVEPAIVVDTDTGSVLHAEAANRRWAPASLTKLMTLYLAFEAMAVGKLDGDEPLTVSKTAAGQPPTRLGLRAGETLSADDAIAAVATASANDVAVVLAERLAGSEAAFAALMTQTARRLGMSRTAFVNASGLPASGQYTTARDMAILADALLDQFPQHYGVFATRAFRHAGRSHGTGNSLLGSYRGADGMKTGFTCAAGYNLVASAERDGRRLIGVVLGGGTRGKRNRRMAKLLDAGFKQGPAADPAVRLAALQPEPGIDPEPPPERLSPGTCASAANAGKQRLSGWGLLFGVYTEKSAARAAVTRARRALRGVMNAGRPVYLPRKLENGTSWKALMVGLRKEQAGQACKHLWKKKLTCVPQAPQLMRHPQFARR